MIGDHVGTLGPEHFSPILADTIDQHMPNVARPRGLREVNPASQRSLCRGGDPVGLGIEPMTTRRCLVVALTTKLLGHAQKQLSQLALRCSVVLGKFNSSENKRQKPTERLSRGYFANPQGRRRRRQNATSKPPQPPATTHTHTHTQTHKHTNTHPHMCRQGNSPARPCSLTYTAAAAVRSAIEPHTGGTPEAVCCGHPAHPQCPRARRPAPPRPTEPSTTRQRSRPFLCSHR